MTQKNFSKRAVGRMFFMAFVLVFGATEFGSVLCAQEGVQGSLEGGSQVTSNLAGVVTSTQNPAQIAILHWYSANLTTQFAVGNTPVGVAFDGASVWVVNSADKTVDKLRASDGTILGSFAVGGNPLGVAFDGANIWVANYHDDTVTKLRASDGALQGTFTVGSGPVAVAFDGANIWVTNVGSNNVTKLQASNGTVR